MNKIYKKLKDIEHVLHRPDMYIGSIINQESIENIYDEKLNKIYSLTVNFNAGLYKIFDEAIINSIDESKRNKKLNIIKIDINNEFISIYDNGGIIIKKLKEYNNIYIPELIFSQLRTGSNFDDNENRIYGGLFGIGIKATNIFSKKFIVETCDGTNKYKQEFNNNLSIINKPKIVKSKEKGYTKITFYPDLEKLKLDIITDDNIKIIKKRIIDLAGINQNIKFYFNNELIKIKSFEEYCCLYNIDINNFIYEENEKWKIGITYSDNGFKQISFVNGVLTKSGGTHVEYIYKQIVELLRPYIEKKYKIQIKPLDIRNHLYLFISATIINNRFTSQTKEKLITDEKDFGSYFEISTKIFNKLIKTELINRIVDWKIKKDEISQKYELNKIKKDIEKIKIPNLIDCNSKNKQECSISIFEGASAGSHAVKYRNTKTQAIYLLRGKVLNINNISPKKILLNKELSGLITSLGLDIMSNDISNLRYDKINLVTDMDCLLNDTIIKCENEDKNIKDININDKVLTHDNTYKSVIAKKESIPNNIIEIKVNGSIIKCTENHKLIILRNEKIEIIYAKDLLYSDFLLIKNNDHLNIINKIINNNNFIINLSEYKLVKPNSIKKIENTENLFFTDITVEDNNSFFIVSNDNLILSHNCDGANICSLLINFFATYWPDLFKYNHIYRSITPLIVIYDGKNKKYIYSEKEYTEYMEKNTNKNIKISYKKGLGSLSDDEYKNIMMNPVLLKITLDNNYKESLYNWFGNNTDIRKQILLNN